MSKKRDVQLILEDIIEDINRIDKFTYNINTLEDFVENELVYYAVLKALENIGEAVKNIPEEIKNNYSYEWRKIAGIRDIIIHEYFGIDASIICGIYL